MEIQLHKEGRRHCENPDMAARQFLGLVREFIVWPKVMTIEAPEGIPPTEKVIEEAILMFLTRYAPRSSRKLDAPTDLKA
jgi:hypothetical protein